MINKIFDISQGGTMTKPEVLVAPQRFYQRFDDKGANPHATLPRITTEDSSHLFSPGKRG